MCQLKKISIIFLYKVKKIKMVDKMSTIRMMKESLNENLDINGELFINKSNPDTYKNLDISLRKRGYVLYTYRVDLRRDLISKINRDADIFAGIMALEDCIIRVYNGNNLYETLNCKKNKIVYLRENINFLITNHYYNEYKIHSDRNVGVNLVYIFLEDDIRRYIGQQNIVL